MTEEKLREANVLSHGIKEMVESIHELEENREHILAPDKMRITLGIDRRNSDKHTKKDWACPADRNSACQSRGRY